MPYADREKRIEYLRNYRRERGLSRQPKRSVESGDILAYNRRHYALHRERMKEMAFKKQQSLKAEVLVAYGGKCALCGESTLEFLTLDHVNNDGAKDRVGKNNMYTWAKKNGYPNNLQCLCFNCNLGKGILLRYREKVSPPAETRRRQRARVLQHYGGKCSCCAEDRLERLAVDHVGGGGCKHKKEKNGYIYSEIIAEGFTDKYRILCHNCNFSARMGNGCCIHVREKEESKLLHYRRLGYVNPYERVLDISEQRLEQLRNEHGDILPSILSQVIQECGIPIPEKRTTREHALEDFKWLTSTKCYIEKQQRVGMVSSNYFHETSMWDVITCKGVTPRGAWLDPKWLDVICKGISLAQGHGITSVNLRRYVHLNVGLPTQFRPAVAKALYNRYASGGRVLDCCAGWGDRLAGFWASDAAHYTGVDPHLKLHQGYADQTALYSEVLEKSVEFICTPVESITKSLGRFDFGFTSPPYYDKEIYTDSLGQSTSTWKSYEAWRDNFLFRLIQLQADSCETYAINVSKELAQDVVALAERCGSNLVETHKYMLPRRPTTVKGAERWEPILVFRG